MGLFGGDKEALEHILQNEEGQADHQEAAITDGIVQHLALCAQQRRRRADDENADSGEDDAQNQARPDEEAEIAVGLFPVALAQRDAHDGAAAGAKHEAHRAHQHGQGHDKVDRRKGRFAHKVRDAQAVHDAVDGSEQHGADAGQHEPQQAGIGKMIGQLDGFLWHSSSFLNFTYAKRPDKNHRSGAFPLLLRHYGAHSLREARTMTSYPALQLR